MSVDELITQLKAMSLPATEAEKVALVQVLESYGTEHNAILSLSGKNLTPTDIQNLCEALKRNTTIKTLILSFLRNDSNDPNYYINPFSISDNPDYEATLNALKNLLRHNSNLTTLSLSGNKIMVSQAYELLTALSENQQSALTTLYLDSNLITLANQHYNLFLEKLAETKIKKISLKGNDMRLDSMPGILWLLQNPDKNLNLQEFNLDHNHFFYTDTIKSQFAQAIKDNTMGPARSPTFLGKELGESPQIKKAFLEHAAKMEVRSKGIGTALGSTSLPTVIMTLIKDFLGRGEVSSDRHFTEGLKERRSSLVSTETQTEKDISESTTEPLKNNSTQPPLTENPQESTPPQAEELTVSNESGKSKSLGTRIKDRISQSWLGGFWRNFVKVIRVLWETRFFTRKTPVESELSEEDRNAQTKMYAIIEDYAFTMKAAEALSANQNLDPKLKILLDEKINALKKSFKANHQSFKSTDQQNLTQAIAELKSFIRNTSQQNQRDYDSDFTTSEVPTEFEPSKTTPHAIQKPTVLSISVDTNLNSNNMAESPGDTPNEPNKPSTKRGT